MPVPGADAQVPALSEVQSDEIYIGVPLHRSGQRIGGGGGCRGGASVLRHRCYYAVRYLDYTRLMRQGLMTNMLSWQDKVYYRKSALDYATLGRTF